MVALAAIALLLVGWHASIPVIGPATYSYEQGAAEEGSLPVNVPTAGRMLAVRFDLQVAWLHPTAFAVRADDCLDSLTVDGRSADLGRMYCFPVGGNVSLAGLLHTGSNAVEMRIRDHGGRGGVNFGVSMADPLVLAFASVLLLIVAASVVFALRTFGARHLVVPVLATIAVALAVRIPLLPSPGFDFDTNLNAHWAKSAVVLGIGPSYLQQIDDTRLPNYPPLQMAIFAVTGRAYRALLSPTYDLGLRECETFMKLPAVLGDVAMAVLLLLVVSRISTRRIAPWLAGIGYAIQPGVFYESAVWGQVDALFALGAVGCLVAAWRRSWFLMGWLVGTALLTKFQAIVVVPMLLALCAVDRRAIPRAALGAFVSLLPAFALVRTMPAFHAVKAVYTESSGFFPFLSMYAYNVWVALYGLGAREHTDATAVWGPLTYRHIGLAIFAAITIFATAKGALRLRSATSERSRAWVLFVVPVVTVYAFFLFNTEMHERYLFLLVPLGVVMVAAGRGLWPYLAASLLFFLNLVGVFPWTSLDRAAFKELSNLPGVIGICNVVVFLAIARRLRRRSSLQ